MKVSFDINMYCNSLFPCKYFLCLWLVCILYWCSIFLFSFAGRKSLGAAKVMNCGSTGLHTLISNSSYPGALF
jgi:hypothetical protein